MAIFLQCPECKENTATCYFKGYVLNKNTPRFGIECNNPECMHEEIVDIDRSEKFWSGWSDICFWCKLPPEQHSFKPTKRIVDE